MECCCPSSSIFSSSSSPRGGGACCSSGASSADSCVESACLWCSTTFEGRECVIACPIIPIAACEACIPEAPPADGTSTSKFLKAARYSLVDPAASRYIFACATYLAYAMGIIMIDVWSFGGYQFNYGNVILGGQMWMSPGYTNMLYAVFAVIHFVNAWQFAWGWWGRKWYDVVLWPEYMNVMGACLYLISASYYPAATVAEYALIPDPNSPDPANPVYITNYYDPNILRVRPRASSFAAARRLTLALPDA